MVLTYGTALMSCCKWAETKMQLERGQSDSLDETDLAFWQGSKSEKKLVALEHGKHEQLIHECCGEVSGA